MKLTRAAAVIGAAVVLVAGGAVAVNAAAFGPDTVTLCGHKLTKLVTTSSAAGTCPRGSTAMKLASADAVQALQTHVDDLQRENQTQADQIAALAGRLDDLHPSDFTVTGQWVSENRWRPTFNGTNLLPGADVFVTHVQYGSLVAQVDANGQLNSVQDSIGFVCTFLPATFETTTAQGNPIYATVSSVPGC